MKMKRLSLQQVRIPACLLVVSLLVCGGLRGGEIHDAAAFGDLDKVKELLLAEPALLESKDRDGETPLIKACVGVGDNVTHFATASFLVARGANVNASGLAGRTPLMCVNQRQGECLDLMQRLIAKGADVNARMSYTSRTWTVFCGAAKSGNAIAGCLVLSSIRNMSNPPLCAVQKASGLVGKSDEPVMPARWSLPSPSRAIALA